MYTKEEVGVILINNCSLGFLQEMHILYGKTFICEDGKIVRIEDDK